MRQNCLAAGTPRLHWESMYCLWSTVKARSLGASAIVRGLRKKLQYMDILVLGSLLCAPIIHMIVNRSPPRSS
jgi:hypothetical protein